MPTSPRSRTLAALFALLQVLGNAKGVVAVVISLLYFRNPVNAYSVIGYAITVTGVVLYSQVGGRCGPAGAAEARALALSRPCRTSAWAETALVIVARLPSPPPPLLSLLLSAAPSSPALYSL